MFAMLRREIEKPTDDMSGGQGDGGRLFISDQTPTICPGETFQTRRTKRGLSEKKKKTPHLPVGKCGIGIDDDTWLFH